MFAFGEPIRTSLYIITMCYFKLRIFKKIKNKEDYPLETVLIGATTGMCK